MQVSRTSHARQGDNGTRRDGRKSGMAYHHGDCFRDGWEEVVGKKMGKRTQPVYMMHVAGAKG